MMPNPHVKVGAATFGNDLPLTLIAGPCQLESRAHAFDMAGRLKEMAAKLKIGFVYKTSFDKANRTSLTGKRGLGLNAALAIFADLRKELGVPILTDVHEREQCAEIAAVVDVLQIPAFLSRQTDLLIAAAETGKVVNVKKGQFLAPWDMKNVADKIVESGNRNVLLTERGASFGYNTLVSDMRALPIMAETGCPGDLRRDPFGAAAGRAGDLDRRRSPLRAGAGAGGGRRRRRRRLHRDASGPGQRALRRAEHGADQGTAGADRRADGDRPHRQGATLGHGEPLLAPEPRLFLWWPHRRR